MITHEYSTLFGNDSIDKQLVIKTDNGLVTITNTELHNEAFTLEEKICDENNLVFGLAEPSKLEFTVSNVFTDLKNKWITVTTTLNKDTANSFQIGRYKVNSDIPTADRKKRNVVAYDALYDVLQADVSAWYNSILPNQSSTTTLKAFRNSFFAHFGIEQEEVTLVNDNMVVAKTIQPEELSGKTVINAICEINGCFGHIGRNGKFKYVFLEQIKDALYPSHDLYPSEELYPIKVTGATLTSGLYIPPATYENYVTNKISGLVIRQEEDDIGSQVGSMDNAYVIQDNFLVYGKSASDLDTIGNNVLGVIKDIVYRPFNTKAKGNFCVEVGDFIRLSTKNQKVESYVLQRTITGIQALRDDYTAEGEEKLAKATNSVSRQIQQLKGKANILTRTVDETRLEMVDIEKDLRSEILATAEQISLKVSAGEVQSMINVSIDNISLSASQIRLEGYTTINGGFSIDEQGQAVLRDGNTTMTVAENGVIISHGRGTTIYGTSDIAINSKQIITVSDVYGITIGTSEAEVICKKINGYTPITDNNINSYVTDYSYDISLLERKVSELDTDVSNALSDAQTALDSVSDNGTEIIYIKSDIEDLKGTVSTHSGYISSFASEIGQLKARVAALEAAI